MMTEDCHGESMVQRSLYRIPVDDDATIIYRPLRHLAFMGNRALAELLTRLQAGETTPDDLDPELRAFLDKIGYFEQDPEPPPLPSPEDTLGMVTLLMTTRCNLRCTYCYANGGEEPILDLPLPIARRAVAQVCQEAQTAGHPDFQMCLHGGGEPVQSWDSLQAAVTFAHAQPLPCHISLVSNGVWSERQRAWLLEHVNDFSISFDGRPETQDSQRPFPSGAGSSQQTLATLAALDEAKAPYGIRLTATPPFVGRLPEDVRYICETTQCGGMQVEPAFVNERGLHHGATEEMADEFIAAFMAAWEIANEHGRRLDYSGARPDSITATFCGAPYGGLVVHPRGRLMACYEVANDSHPLLEEATVGTVDAEAVHRDREARRQLLDGIEAHRESCRDCYCNWHCAGDCFARTRAAQERDEGAIRCRINREITRQMLLWHIMAGDGVWQGQQLAPSEFCLPGVC